VIYFYICDNLSGLILKLRPLHTDIENQYLMNLTNKLKELLWQSFGTPSHPAEWDGMVYGGGKISQRFWEYFMAIEMLGLTKDSILLDIGGGSPATGLSIFPKLIAELGVQLVVVDQDFGVTENSTHENVTLERCLADQETLSHIIKKHSPTHISCISVLEHASYSQQQGIFQAIDNFFNGEKAVFTFEFHETICHFEQQLTTQTLSECASLLKRFYLNRIKRSPLNCVNSINNTTRLWYPLAVQFERNSP
jgi:hypothetical protein